MIFEIWEIDTTIVMHACGVEYDTSECSGMNGEVCHAGSPVWK